MDFDFTEEQLMLRGLARELLTAECPPTEVRAQMEDARGYSPSLWRQLAETGLLGIAVDEAHGGQALGMVELALVLEEMGRAAYPGPYLPTVVLAASALAAGGSRAQLDRYLTGIADGSVVATLALMEDRLAAGPEGIELRARAQGGEYVLTGHKRFVPFGHVADLILVAARTSEATDPRAGVTIFALDRDTPGISHQPNVQIDLTNKTSTLTLENVRVGADAVVGQVDGGWKILDGVLRRASVAAAAVMLGSARKCMELSVEYAKVREQFGQPIGTFQAIKHACAEMLVEVENAHGATYYAAWALDAAAPDAAFAASVAKSYVGEAARKVCGSAIQVHGGIGFTWEYDLHLYFKQAKLLEALYGDAEHHREQVLTEILAPAAVPALA
ncbi:MAG: acyl-CoA/acyl-ACP dehydrogenase [Chloroflexi bacterium]|nr:acyl-CoA/acyl-ACP dehydrogenase [Chloroflexota bacterium]